MINPGMTFPMKKRINTELLVDRMAALSIVNGRIKNVARVVKHWMGYTPSAKDAGMRCKAQACFHMTFTGM